ncbi:hypothetical protein OE09_2635 [Flavobacteriaceae bacterium MAR_2010_72]|nr:hypothetical protein OE09_2635 [Flavobacteriaceae bacterium MAR_2010_72]TVZ58663.1 hypothetical protein NA63_1169 [Flavobacteriaceae bacterium MAR_2010_105]
MLIFDFKPFGSIEEGSIISLKYYCQSCFMAAVLNEFYYN